MLHVPINIRPHLVSFFFYEMEGEEIHYLNVKEKTIALAFSSTLSKFLRFALSKTDKPVKLDNMKMLLSIEDKNFSGSIYQCESGKKNFLYLPLEINEDINEFLEDFFRVALVYYVLGHSENNDNPCISNALQEFIIKYDLYEFGFDIESLRRYYYREIKKHTKLARITKKKYSVTK